MVAGFEVSTGGRFWGVHRGNMNELKRLLSSLLSLHQALFDLFWNGQPPVLHRIRYSAKLRKGLSAQSWPHERIVAQVEEVLLAIARANGGRKLTTARAR